MLLNNQVKQSPIIGLAGMGGGIASYVFLSAGGAYEIARSLRFDSGSSAYLDKTFSSGSGTTWTLSFWVKKTGNDNHVFGAGNVSTDRFGCGFNGSDKFFAFVIDSNSTVFSITTDAVYRDPSAWYHVVLVADTTNGTQADRFKIYINGVRQTVTGTLMPDSQNTKVNSATTHTFGRRSYTASDYFNGYLGDVWFIDGQALEPTAFGKFDATTGVWNPKRYTGAKSGNSFHLPFSDATSTTTLGYDDSGNNNNWTLNNFSVAAGAGNDSLRDSPTNGDTANDTGLGGEVPGNYCTWNSLIITTNNTLSQGNLRAVHAASSWSGNIRGSNSSMFVGTFGVSSGKWYWEITMNDAGNTITGVVSSAMGHQYYVGHTNNLSAGFVTASLYQDSSWGTYQSMPTLANGDIVGVALDMDNGKLWFSKNGTFVNSGNPAAGTGSYTTGITGTLYPALSNIGSTGPADGEANFGQRAFAYTAPSGFKALCTANLTPPTIAKPSTVMDVETYIGNGTSLTISGLGFSPDLVWIKGRDFNSHHRLYDQIRSATYSLRSSATDAEAVESQGLTAFTSDGFTLGSDPGHNNNGQAHVAWTWDAGSSTVSNTDGSISSSVRANASAGFSIVTYTGGATNSTVGHGLGVAPAFIICKSRTSAQGWPTYHYTQGKDKVSSLNTTDAYNTNSNYWGTSEPTSSVFGVADANYANNDGNMVAYCFAPVAGYSAFGSYTGNGNTTGNGPFVYTGFRPALIIIKSQTSGSDAHWVTIDAKRIGYNGSGGNPVLYPNRSNIEYGGDEYQVDILSNGFQIKANYTDGINFNGIGHVYAAFAESPFSTQARAR